MLHSFYMDILSFPTAAGEERRQAQDRQDAIQNPPGVVGRLLGDPEVKKIIKRHIQEYRQKKHEMIKKARQQRMLNEYNRPLREARKDIYGYGRYNVEYRQQQADHLEEMGESREAARARREADRAERHAQEAYERHEKEYIRHQTRALIKARKEGIRAEVDQLKAARNNPTAGTSSPSSFMQRLTGLHH